MILRRAWIFLLFVTGPCLLFAQEVDKELLLQDLRYLASDELEGRKTLTDGNQKAREYIKRRFESLGLTSQYSDYTQFFPVKDGKSGNNMGQGANIVGFIPGQESAKIIVITAHYDHLGKVGDEIFNGADDNASGTAGLLSLAAYFAENNPKYSMIFAALDAEEKGLQGARALVKDFPFPLKDVLLNINMDMISRSVKNELFATGTSHYPQLKSIIEEVSENKVNLRFGHDEPGIGAQDWTFASDHAVFHEAGIPFIYFGVEDHVDYHKATDTFGHIDQDFYYHAVNLILQCVKAFDEQL
jgi:Zn-dependent M28 family amino/carboxypeptidase